MFGFLSIFYNLKDNIMYVILFALIAYIGVLKYQNISLEKDNNNITANNAKLVLSNAELGTRLSLIIDQSDKLKKDFEINKNKFNSKQNEDRKVTSKKVNSILTAKLDTNLDVNATEAVKCVSAFNFIIGNIE